MADGWSSTSIPTRNYRQSTRRWWSPKGRNDRPTKASASQADPDSEVGAQTVAPLRVLWKLGPACLDEAGAFALRGLVPGEYVLRAHHFAFAMKEIALRQHSEGVKRMVLKKEGFSGIWRTGLLR